MRNRFLGSLVGLVAILGLTQVLFAQNDASSKTPATKSTKAVAVNPHDISGFWSMPNLMGISGKPSLGNKRPPLTAWGYARWSQTKGSGRKTELSFGYYPEQKDWNDPAFVCDPSGYPRIGVGNTEYRFVDLPNEVVEFFERDRFWRDLWTDGRKLPAEPKPRWYGYSVAHWDGDTLVVNSAHYDDRAWLDNAGSPLSDQMQLEERYKILDRDHINVSLKLTDPKTYTAPWVSNDKQKQIMVREDASSGIPPDVWGKAADGKVYGDTREDMCIYSQEHGFWVEYDPEGVNGHFENLPDPTGEKPEEHK